MESVWGKLKKILQNYEELVVLSLLGIGIGLLVSVFEVLFGYGLKAMIDIHESVGSKLLLGLPLAGLLIV